MIAFPQQGGCLCGEIRYRLDDDGLTLYACHCTDCQRQTGSSCSLSLLIRKSSFEILRGRTAEYDITLSDGRRKSSQYCSRCCTRLCSPSRVSELVVLEAATLDDTSWLQPIAHIWMRSAQPWLRLPDDVLVFDQGSTQSDPLAFVRAWKNRE